VLRFMLKSKIHRATLTGADLAYEGSITIDRTLIEAADLVVGEQVHVLNLSNGSRIVTYVIEGEEGSGAVVLNGPAARSGVVGDQVTILAYAGVTEDEARSLRPKIVKVNGKNGIRH
jgi:aspartate 1-decarboxylase